MFFRRYRWVGLCITALFGLLMSWAEAPRRMVEDSPMLLQAAPAFDERLTEDEARSVQVYQASMPAVVHITTVSTSLDEALQAQERGGVGSGVMIDARGYLITNYHVIKGVDALLVQVPGYKKPYTAKIIGQEPAYDFALLKLEAPTKTRFQTLPIGNSESLTIGQEVFAIGSPLGLKGTLTKGIISSLNRPLPAGGGRTLKMIQLDASINPGNSGGALLNSSGELIGINTLGVLPGQSSTGLNFALPIKPLVRFAEDYIAYGEIQRPYVGVTLGLNINPDIAKLLDLAVTNGVMIEKVDAYSPAEKAGLQSGLSPAILANGDRLILGGDIITAMNGRAIYSSDEIVNTLHQYRPGDTVTFSISKAGKHPPTEVGIILKEPSAS